MVLKAAIHWYENKTLNELMLYRIPYQQRCIFYIQFPHQTFAMRIHCTQTQKKNLQFQG